MPNMNISRTHWLAKGWDPRKGQPKFEGYYRNLHNKPGPWYVNWHGSWHLAEAGSMGETVDDLARKEWVTVSVVVKE